MKIAQTLLLCLLLAVPLHAKSSAASSSDKVQELQSRVNKLEKELKGYEDLEQRMKETSSALANLNTEVNRIESDLHSVSVDVQARAKTEQPKTADVDKGAKVDEDVALLQTEVSFIRQEIAKLQEAKVAEKAIEEQKGPESTGGKPGSFRQAISSPWLGFLALLVAIVGLFT